MDLRPAGEVDRGPPGAPATGGQAREEMADLEAAVTADGLLLGVRMDAKLNSGAYPCDPFPGAMFVDSISGGRSRGRPRSRGSRPRNTAVFSNKATYVSYRGPGPRPTSCGSGCSTSSPGSSTSTRSTIRRRNYVERDQPPLAMLSGQPFTGVTTRECVEQAAQLVDWDGFRAARRSCGPSRSLPRASGWRPTWRRPPGPSSRGRTWPATSWATR